VASPLARRQAAAGDPLLTSLRHEEVRLEDERDRALLALLDGTRDRGALSAATGLAGAELEDALGRVAWLGLLQA
jgi:hypothetical protein